MNASKTFQNLSFISLFSFVSLSALLSSACQKDESAPAVTEGQYAERRAETYCDAIFNCNCDQNPYLSRTECELEIADATSELQSQWHRLGLEFDDVCAGESVQRIADFGCKSRKDLRDKLEGWSDDQFACPVYSGLGRERDQCTSFDDWSTCLPGLQCANSGDGPICVRPETLKPTKLRENDICAGAGMMKNSICGDGLYCEADGSQRCLKYDKIGSPCRSRYSCDPESSYCDDAINLCQGLIDNGMRCFGGHSCKSGVCLNDVCVEADPYVCTYRDE